VGWAVLGLRLDSIILKVFSNLKEDKNKNNNTGICRGGAAWGKD